MSPPPPQQRSAPSQQSSGGGDNAFAPIWLTILLFITCYFLWKAFHAYVVESVFFLNVWQARFIGFFFSDPQLVEDVRVMQTVDPAAVNWSQLVALTTSVGTYTRYPVIAVLAVLAVILYFSNVKLKFRKTHSMATLRNQEQHNWPSILPVTKTDLVNMELDEGPWAVAMNPMEFARRQHLLRKNDELLDTFLPGQECTAGLKRGDAKRVFTLQLGPYWEGFSRCSPPTFALAAVFIARMNRDRDAAMSILETLDKAYGVSNRPNFLVVNKVIKKYHNTKDVQAILGKHAYVLTIMASLLEAARQDGVVPACDFLWLKVVDRRLWYMLNCVGRQTPFVEVAGPFAHWRAEKAMRRRSLVPMIDEATKGLELAIKEVKLSSSDLRELEA